MKPSKLFLLFLLAMMAFTTKAQEGAWSGSLDVFGTKLPLVFNFSQNGCTIDSPSQNAKDIPADKKENDDGTIAVTIGMIGAKYEGKMENGEIKGTFRQNDLSLPLTLTPGKPVVKRARTDVQHPAHILIVHLLTHCLFAVPMADGIHAANELVELGDHRLKGSFLD